jgi:hypothetical protein
MVGDGNRRGSISHIRARLELGSARSNRIPWGFSHRLVVADVRDRALDPRLVTTDKRNHARAIDSPQRIPLTPVQHHPHVGTRRFAGFVPVEERVDDAQ